MAKQLALDMFGSTNDIIRLDMSEYTDRTAVSKLIGTTAGYVGYDDNSNTLTERYGVTRTRSSCSTKSKRPTRKSSPCSCKS